MPAPVIDAATRRLYVRLDAEHVGTLYDTSPLSFRYASTWVTEPRGPAIATLTLTAELQYGREVSAFFENLLPEGELRDYLAQRHHAASLFSLLLTSAGDTVGAFVLTLPDCLPGDAGYTSTTWDALAESLRKHHQAAIDLNGDGARISLAGAQDKASIAIFADGIVRLPKGIAPSTHILKPSIKRLDKVWESAANETIVMRLASHCSLDAADVFFEPKTDSCVVRRFDRIDEGNGRLKRIPQYDFCQLSGVLSEGKYESEGGPGIERCASLIREISTQPAVDLKRLAQWVLFNLYVGNDDCHAKNLSLFEGVDGGLVLTPFYDLMCTRIYPGLSRRFALSIADEDNPGKMTNRHLCALAKQLGIHPRFLTTLAMDLAQRMPGAIEAAITDVRPALTARSATLAERLARFILSSTRKMAARLIA